ncbi:hypothetical protein GGR56DRAFT_374123 [Xylariaceae sp. FL0804]|nr:hypothetical protein GGR56DRAFT_374123 [Xylariaceae sp. FL0804]
MMSPPQLWLGNLPTPIWLDGVLSCPPLSLEGSRGGADVLLDLRPAVSQALIHGWYIGALQQKGNCCITTLVQTPWPTNEVSQGRVRSPARRPLPPMLRRSVQKRQYPHPPMWESVALPLGVAGTSCVYLGYPLVPPPRVCLYDTPSQALPVTSPPRSRTCRAASPRAASCRSRAHHAVPLGVKVEYFLAPVAPPGRSPPSNHSS